MARKAQKISYISYAQNGEDIILAGLLDDIKDGFYVDVGANHPVHESVTKHFYKHGWHGMNIEPSPRLHALLVADRPRDINLMVGVSDKDSELLFRDYKYGDGLSTFSQEMQKMYEESNYYFASSYTEYKVPVTTLKEIFKQHKVGTIDFLKVDIEGYEYEALVGNDWEKYRPRVICIESNHIVKDWHPLIAKAGYTLVFFDGLNEYFVRNEDKKRITTFSYPDKVLLYNNFEPWVQHNKIVDLERDKRLLRHEAHHLERQLAAAQASAGISQLLPSPKAYLKQTVKRLDDKIENRLAPESQSTVGEGMNFDGLDDRQLITHVSSTVRAVMDNQFHAGKRRFAAPYQRIKSRVLKRGKI